MGWFLAFGAAGCLAASQQRDVLRYDVGRGTRGDIELAVPETLIRHGYLMRLRRETRTLLYFETSWHHRQPFEDEVERCARECRSRIIVEARRRSGDLFAVTLRAENSYLGVSPGFDTEEGGVWTSFPPTAKFREHVDELSAEIGMKIDAGVRVHR